MKEFKNLLQVKKLIALLLTLTMCTLVLLQMPIPEEFKVPFLMVIAFYYGQSTVTGAMYVNENVKGNK